MWGQKPRCAVGLISLPTPAIIRALVGSVNSSQKFFGSGKKTIGDGGTVLETAS
jgi:hypothetical protein